MPITSHAGLWRLVGVGAAALALSTATATAAHAGDRPGGHGWDSGQETGYEPGKGAGVKTAADRCEFSLDGQSWKASVQVDDLNLKPSEDGKVHVKVRAAGDAASCTASLASYRTFGATWATSGKQVFHDFDTVNVTAGTTDTLDTGVPDAGCFAQVDLYRGGVKYDGKTGADDGFEHGDLPVGPDRPVIKDKLIASWNGGTKDCTQQTPPAPTKTPSGTPSTPGSQSPSASTTPSTSTSASAPAPSASETVSPSASVSASPSETAAPVASDSVSGSASATPATGNLAETGGGGVATTAAGAVALLAAGGGVLFFMRRRGAVRSH